MINWRKLIKYAINPEYFEVRITYYITILVLITLLLTGVYSNFYELENLIIDLLKNILFSLISLLGILLTALALIITLFYNDWYFSYLDDKTVDDDVENILDDFPYISIQILFEIFVTVVMLLLINSSYPVVNFIFFLIAAFFFIYVLVNIIVRIAFISYSTVNVFKGLKLIAITKNNNKVHIEERTKNSIAIKGGDKPMLAEQSIEKKIKDTTEQLGEKKEMKEILLNIKMPTFTSVFFGLYITIIATFYSVFDKKVIGEYINSANQQIQKSSPELTIKGIEGNAKMLYEIHIYENYEMLAAFLLSSFLVLFLSYLGLTRINQKKLKAFNSEILFYEKQLSLLISQHRQEQKSELKKRVKCFRKKTSANEDN